MKQLLISIFILSLVSCQSNFHTKTGIVKVLYRATPRDQLQYSDSAVFTIKKVRQLDEDSSSTSAKFVPDTSWVILIPNLKDTIKDPKTHKPLYDSVNKTYHVNQVWYKLTPAENKTVKIQIVTI